MAIRLHKIDTLEYDGLRGFEKAAILVNYLGPEAAKSLFKHLDDADIRKLLGTMHKYRIVPVDVTKKVLEEFYEMVSESEDYIFSDLAANKDTIIAALGEERARGVLGHLSATSSQRTLESLEIVDAKSLANFLINEHPQTPAAKKARERLGEPEHLIVAAPPVEVKQEDPKSNLPPGFRPK